MVKLTVTIKSLFIGFKIRLTYKTLTLPYPPQTTKTKRALQQPKHQQPPNTMLPETYPYSPFNSDEADAIMGDVPPTPPEYQTREHQKLKPLQPSTSPPGDTPDD